MQNKIEQIIEAIVQADRLKSKLEYPVIEVPSFTSTKIRHLLNNLGAISSSYLECGTHKGGHFCSVLYKNDIKDAVALDDYSEFYVNGETKEECLANINRYAPKHTRWSLFEQDCFTAKFHPKLKFDLYNYDAQHTESAQQRAMTHFVDNLADECIVVVDDWAFNGVEDGTRMGIRLAGMEVLFESVMLTPEGALPEDNWHNGFAVFLLKKQ